ncbi:MAG: hypothetical protein M1308_09880 [Actinobacteria bacterium]|nr:hypothetical protein [Actinomycetota bacterium]
MGKKVIKMTKILVSFGIVLVLALTIGLAGCKKTQVAETSETTTQVETTVQEETSSGTSETTQETGGKINNMEITGNINILSGLEISDKVLSIPLPSIKFAAMELFPLSSPNGLK